MEFPQSISFTVTNACNLRCRMCGQWSDEGYMRGMLRQGSNYPEEARPHPALTIADWKRLVDEVAAHGVGADGHALGQPHLSRSQTVRTPRAPRLTYSGRHNQGAAPHY